jgi:hypothetical protein
MASLAQADVYPLNGTASFQIDWAYAANGPSFAFEGGELVDHSIYAFCTVGMPCDLSASLTTGGSCGEPKICTATLDGKTYSFLEGDISFTVRRSYRQNQLARIVLVGLCATL